MNPSVTIRVAAAVDSFLVTFGLLESVALMARIRPAGAEIQLSIGPASETYARQ
jgi:hypothetical protein